MKILTVLTGGTIGSVEKNHTLDVADKSCKVVDMFKKSEYNNPQVVFDVFSPVNILSENMSVEYWNVLLKWFKRVNFSEYDGVILTHGSDTLSYTAAILSFCFADIAIPLVVVASDYPLDFPKSNGLKNFSSAVQLISSKTTRGIFVAYGTQESTDIYLASRLCEAEPFLDKFRGFTGTPYAKCNETGIEFLKSKFNPSLDSLNKERKPILKEIPEIKNCVQIIIPHPSFDYDSVNLCDNTKAVLHMTYHSGTASAQNRNTASAFLEKCKAKSIDFYFCSLKNTEDMYVTTKEIIDKGAIPLYNISKEAAFAKLLIAYSQDEMLPAEFMKKQIFYEEIIKEF